MADPRLTALAQGLPETVPFVGPETQERALGRRFAARLGANESAFGPSPQAVKAMAEAAQEVWMYGDPESFDLRHALGAHHGISPEAITVGEGIDGLLGSLVRLTVAPGDPVVTSAGAYPTFAYHVAGFGGVLHQVPYRDDQEDPEALIAQARAVGAKLIYLANPDNPMGTWHSAARIQAMIDAVPAGCLLVLDEAYIDLAPEGTAPDLDPDALNVIRMRTFSKGYGMAGARVGYAIGPAELIRDFDRVRNHFGLSRISQAGALAALADQAWLTHIKAETRTARTRIAEIGAAQGLRALPSATNFVTLDCGQDARFAKAILEGLIAGGIFVRMPFVAPQNRCIRVSCGPETLLHALEQALPTAIAAAQANSRPSF